MADPLSQTAAPSTGTLAFQCKDVSSYFGEAQIIKNVSLDICTRRVTAFMGPSGCGKSTILRTLNRMHETAPGAHVAGEVLFEGKNIYDSDVDPVDIRATIGMVFQKPNPFPKSIFDNIAFGPRLLGLASSPTDLHDIVEQSLKRVGLWDEISNRLQDSALGLSGGQQQRLIIARAIATKPSAILLDEPCSALDPKATASVEDLIRELREDYCVVIVTHSLAQAQRIADEVAFFYYGELIETGSPAEIFDHPKDQRVKDYLSGKTG